MYYRWVARDVEEALGHKQGQVWGLGQSGWAAQCRCQQRGNTLGFTPVVSLTTLLREK